MNGNIQGAKCIGILRQQAPVVCFFLNWFKLVYGTFKQSNMHLTLDFCSDHLGKKLNVPKLKTKLRVYGLYTLL